MDTTSIDRAFEELLQQRAIGAELKITANYVAQLRNKLKTGIPISTDLKIKLLKQSGWKQSDITFARKDLVAAVRFALGQSKAAKEHGPEYLVEKFLSKKY